MSEKKKRTPRYAVTQLIEVTRSFEYKKPLGKFEMAGFFCSAKLQTTREDAAATAEMLHAFCQAEVKKSLQSFMAARKLKVNPITDGPGPVAIVEPAAAEDVTFASSVRKRAKKETNATDLHDARRAY
jgi:hypothetical protein